MRWGGCEPSPPATVVDHMNTRNMYFNPLKICRFTYFGYKLISRIQEALR